MVPKEFRLDTVSVHLIERLEGARRSFSHQPEKAPEAFRKIVEEMVDGAAQECGQYADEPQYPMLLRREMLETFLPRYTRLAIDHNARERGGFGAWKGGDPLYRVIGAIVTIGVASLLFRELPGVLKDLEWVVVAAIILMPEIRAIWFRWQYRRTLQAVVDDLARIQDQLDVYQITPEKIAMLPTSQASPHGQGNTEIH